MTDQQAATIVGLFAAAHPAWKASKATVALWCDLLSDLPYEQTRDAARRLVATSSDWPSIATLRREVAYDLGVLPPDPDAAWAMVRRGNVTADDPLLWQVMSDLGGSTRLLSMDETGARIAFHRAYTRGYDRAVIDRVTPENSALRAAIGQAGARQLDSPNRQDDR